MSSMLIDVLTFKSVFVHVRDKLSGRLWHSDVKELLLKTRVRVVLFKVKQCCDPKNIPSKTIFEISPSKIHKVA